MKIPGYSIDLERAVKNINDKHYKRVVLQLPEGLKSYYSRIIEFFQEKTDADFIISADPCFGACDLINCELKDLDVDFIVQIGHTPIPSMTKFATPTMFLNALSEIDVSEVVEKAVQLLSGKKIGIVTTAQHIHSINDISKILKDNNFEPILGEGDKRIDSKGQILGCNFSAATSVVDSVDSFLFIGSGNFHPLGLILTTKKPVVACDPYTKKVKSKELDELKDIVLRQRYGAIARSKDAKVFGILVGTKVGQQRIKLAYAIKEKLKSNQKKAYIFSSNYFTPSNLESFRDIDCFISTACPRIAIDDYMQYKTPIITPVELDILIGIKRWEDYQFDEVID